MVDFLFSEGPIEALQGFSSPLLDAVFIAITSSGSGAVLVSFGFLVYWLWDKKLGLLLTLTLLVSGVLNGFLKGVFQISRPQPHLQIVQEEGYGFPSGHAQQTATFWGAVAFVSRRYWTVLAPIFVALVAVSRVYLGVHHIGSVLGGIMIGVLVAFGGYLLLNAGFWGTLSVRTKIVLAALLPSLLLVLMPLEANIVRIWGLLVGFCIGYHLEGIWVRIEPPVRGVFGVVRAALGLPPLVGIYLMTLNLVEPFSLFSIHLAVGLFAALLLPWAFTRIESRLLHVEQATDST